MIVVMEINIAANLMSDEQIQLHLSCLQAVSLSIQSMILLHD